MAYDLDPLNNRLLYLYQLRRGACPSSFGLNVAQLSGIPPAVIERAKEKAHEFAMSMKHVVLSEKSARALTERLRN